MVELHLINAKREHCSRHAVLLESGSKPWTTELLQMCRHHQFLMEKKALKILSDKKQKWTSSNSGNGASIAEQGLSHCRWCQHPISKHDLNSRCSTSDPALCERASESSKGVVPGPQILPNQALAIASVWGVTQQMENISPSLLFLSLWLFLSSLYLSVTLHFK